MVQGSAERRRRARGPRHDTGAAGRGRAARRAAAGAWSRRPSRWSAACSAVRSPSPAWPSWPSPTRACGSTCRSPRLTVAVAVGLVLLVAAGRPDRDRRRRPCLGRAPGRARAGDLPVAGAGLGVRRALGEGPPGWAGRSALAAAVLAVAAVAAVTTFQPRRSTRCSPNPTGGRPTSTPWRLSGRRPTAVQRVAAEPRRRPPGRRGRRGTADRGDRAAARAARSARRGGVVPLGARSDPALGVDRRGGAPARARGAGRAGRARARPGSEVGDPLRGRVSGETYVVRIVGEAVAYGTDQMDEAVVVDPSLTDPSPTRTRRPVRARPLRRWRRRGAGRARAVPSSSACEFEESAPPSTVDRLREIGSLPFVLAGFVAALGVLAVGHALVASVAADPAGARHPPALGMTRRQVGGSSWSRG